jgi:predicted dehydrogenase
MYGSRLLRIFYDCHKNNLVELCAITDINTSVLEENATLYNVRGYEDYKEMVENETLDAVAIITPDFLHEEMALYCADRGLHMLVQKPLDVSTKGATAIAQSAKDNNVLLFVDFHKRYDPSLISLRNRVQSGDLGEILYGYLNIEDRIEIPSIHFKGWAHKSSPVWFIGIHVIDVLNWVLGCLPVSVSSIGAKKKLVSMGIDSFDFIQSRLIYENGACITLDASWILPECFPSIVNQNVKIVGTEGIVEIDGQDRGMQVYTDQLRPEFDNPYGFLYNESSWTKVSLSGYTVDTILHFIKILGELEKGACLSSFNGSYVDGFQAVDATRVSEAIHKSLLKDGKTIVV